MVACHYLDYTQAFRISGEGGAKNGVHHKNKEDDPGTANEKFITYVANVKNVERKGVVPNDVVNESHLGEGEFKKDFENYESVETGQL